MQFPIGYHEDMEITDSNSTFLTSLVVSELIRWFSHA